MNFIKKYKAVILIVLFALIIRLINLDKTGGLWYDEINIYSIASQSFPAGMMKADAHRFLLFPLFLSLSDCHEAGYIISLSFRNLPL